jgi:hypothetical protein
VRLDSDLSTITLGNTDSSTANVKLWLSRDVVVIDARIDLFRLVGVVHDLGKDPNPIVGSDIVSTVEVWDILILLLVGIYMRKADKIIPVSSGSCCHPLQ